MYLKKNKHQNLFFIFLILITQISCENETDWEIKSENIDKIVIESIITNENKFQYVKITKPISSQNEIPAPVSGAKVIINEGNKPINFYESPENSGLYISERKFIAVVNRIYYMNVDYNEKSYAAATGMIPVSTISNLKFSYNDDKKLFFIDSVSVSFDSEESAMWELTIDRSFANNTPDTTISKLYYYKLRTIDVNQIFAPNKEVIYFPKGTKITNKKFSLTPDYEIFIRSLLFETEWTGGFFDTPHSNPETNIIGDAVGYFTACSVYCDTIIVE